MLFLSFCDISIGFRFWNFFPSIPLLVYWAPWLFLPWSMLVKCYVQFSTGPCFKVRICRSGTMFGDLLAKMQITDLPGIRIITVGCKLSKSIFSVNPAFGLIASMCGIALQFRFRSSGYSPRRFKERMPLIISHWWQHCDYVEQLLELAFITAWRICFWSPRGSIGR